MQNLRHLFPKKFSAYIKYNRAIEIILSQWNEILGPIAKHVIPKNIYKNKLVLDCNNPMWVSEIDYFEQKILERANMYLKQKKCYVKIDGIKVVLSSNSFSIKVRSKKVLPKTLKERIELNVKNKKKNGAKLCIKCNKIWDIHSICKLCQLTAL